MNWLFKAIVLTFALTAAAYGPARAQDEGGGGEDAGGEDAGGGEEEKATKTVDANFLSDNNANTSSAGVTYTVPLTPALTFSTTTNLSNGYSSIDQRVSRSRGTSLAIDYDPPSPWRLQVSYSNADDLFHRPASEQYDEFKTKTSSNTANSLLNYDFSEDLKTGLNLTAAENSTRVIITEGRVPPPTQSRTHDYKGNADYNVTKSTTFSIDYSGGMEFSKLEVSQTRTEPPRPVKVMESRKRKDHIGGSLRFGKDITDTFNLSLSVLGNKDLSRDNNLEGATDADNLSAAGGSAITWKPVEMITATNNVDLNRGKNLYPHKYEYLRFFNTPVYDRYSRGLIDTAKISLKPSGASELAVSAEYNETETVIRDADNKLPDEETDPEAVLECLNTANAKVGGSVDISIGQDITFHMTYNRFDTFYKYLITPIKNNSVSSNDLTSNIGFDWTKNLRVDVATGMNQSLNRYDDTATDDSNVLDVDLRTDFYYDVTAATALEFHVGIAKSSMTYPDPAVLTPDSARITRNFSAVARRQFGKVFKPGCTFGMDFARSYFPTSRRTNTTDDTLYITPTADFYTSDALTITLSYNYSNRISDKMFPSSEDDWSQNISYATSAGITYAPTTLLTLSVSASDSHNVNIRNSRRRSKEIPDESYFNMNAGVNFNF